MAGSYELSLDREYWAIRNAAALIDVSPLMKYLITGADAARLLNRVVTRDIDKLQVGQVYYTGWCDEEGKMIDDGTVSRLDESTYRLTCCGSEPALAFDERRRPGGGDNGSRLTAWRRSVCRDQISRSVLKRCCEVRVDELKFFRLMENQVGRHPRHHLADGLHRRPGL